MAKIAQESTLQKLLRGLSLRARLDNNKQVDLSATQEGHLEVSIHDPSLPFGSVHTESLTPIFQFDAVYGMNSQHVIGTSSGSGNATTSNGLFTASTGTTIYSQGIISGRKRLRYRAGQGVIGRCTAMFTAPVANSYQLVGFGTAESGIYVGYGDTNNLSDTRFGILHVKGGVREVKYLTVTTKATSASNVTITLNGTAFTVPVTDATTGTLYKTVWDIATYASYTGWDAYPNGSTIYFVRKSAGVTAGTQSFGAGTTGSAASIGQSWAGVASTDTFIPQVAWNGDKLDGTGSSGVTIDPKKLNPFQFNIGYLGTDETTIKCKVSHEGGNNSTWVTIHTIKFNNSLSIPNYSQPSFPFTLAAYSAGSTANLTVSSASVGGFIEGIKYLAGGRFTYFNSLTTVGASNFQALFTIMNARIYSSRVNQAVINLLNVSGAIKHTSPVIFYLIKNGTLAGNPNFVALATYSCSVYDTAATTVTYATGDQLVATFHVGDTGEFDHHFGNGAYNSEELTLQPGEWITLAAKSTTGTPSYVTGSLNTREDQ